MPELGWPLLFPGMKLPENPSVDPHRGKQVDPAFSGPPGQFKHQKMEFRHGRFRVTG